MLVRQRADIEFFQCEESGSSTTTSSSTSSSIRNSISRWGSPTQNFDDYASIHGSAKGGNGNGNDNGNSNGNGGTIVGAHLAVLR